jgi:hypothetical protein
MGSRATVCYAASALAQRGKALRMKEREIRRSRCETDASWTSIASLWLSVRQDSLLFALCSSLSSSSVIARFSSLS